MPPTNMNSSANDLSSGLRKTPRPRLRSATRLNASPGETPLTTQTSPRRHPRRVETKSPGDDKSEDSGIKLGKDTLHNMYQDVINIKNMLIMLQQVLQDEADSKDDAANKGPGGTHDHHFPGEDGLHLDDLRRQIVLLEMENEEKDLRIKKLEEQLKAANETRPVVPQRSPTLPKLANTSTQTDRVRATTTLFQNSPNNSTASIVSSNETEKAGLRYLRRPQLRSPVNSYKVS